MRDIRLVVFMAGAALAAGCATKSTVPAAPGVQVPAAWSRPATIGDASVGGDLSQWWRTFDDATLSGLVEQALTANLDLKTAQSRVRAARARRVLADKDLRPTVNASSSASTSGTTTSGHDSRRYGFDAGLDASWEPDVFGATRAEVRASEADLAVTTANLRDTQVSLVAEVALNYVELRAYQARLAIANDNLARQSETLQLTQWRAKAGLASELDVEQARTNVEQTRAQMPAYDTNVAEAQNRLAVLLGLAPGALHATLDAVAPVPAAKVRLAIGIPADTLRQRPDIRAAEQQLLAATARLDAAKAARYPSLRLSGSLGLDLMRAAGDVTTSLSRSLLAGLTAPLFDRDRITQQIVVQGETAEQALRAYEQALLRALEDVENALVALANNERRRSALAAAADSARTAAKLARDRYTAGLVSYQTVLDTERSMLSAEDSLTANDADGTSALIRLYKALGGGWTNDAATTAGAAPQL